MLLWHSAASRNGKAPFPTGYATYPCHVERSATVPWAIVQNLRRAVETPREGFGLHAASGNFPDAAASEPTDRATRVPPLHSGISCNDRYERKLRRRGTRSGENSLGRHFFRRHGRGLSTTRPSASRLQIFSRRSAQHDSKEMVWQS
jgi:hypothetical protein